ncbi:(2Fe-2S)-binding protein [Gluconacetobacter azotocaptans]|uniref:(2Fe-2S)-binding protein n=1 Tax=Gluconacetobacter azotocaptans TaxID=142834 RepID=A0A7W4PCE0_9PROT|nr:(2Fe-2S)-binding protein [Gluconacetobacter azotocaptans]MBB2188608.1 (2Fe-2S)-binding protein [Gluconacetobacter azotocaptans]GBQ35376.1 aldehyde dehydrogenase [Gluconacetobacter azotocaptans DSM 13594]
MADGAVEIMVNGTRHAVQVDPGTPLLYVLRNDLGLNGPKYGCGLGECGACTVLIAGRAARSCSVPVDVARHWPITTLEGLVVDGVPDPVQDAFITEQAVQCGYCLNGMVMTVRALLNANPAPTEAEIRDALRYNLCRCGTHMEILNAARRACGLPVRVAAGG